MRILMLMVISGPSDIDRCSLLDTRCCERRINSFMNDQSLDGDVCRIDKSVLSTYRERFSYATVIDISNVC